jgi:hypothetical protein
VPILRRAALAATPVALLLALAACGSDSASPASSTPTSSQSTTTVLLATTTTVLPASTAVGQPVPIGQPTTTAAGQVTPGPGDTTPGATTAGSPTTADGGDPGTTAVGGVPGSPSSTAAPAGQPTSTAAAAGSPTTLDGPNADLPFCQFEAEVEEKTGAAEDDAAFFAALAALEPRMDQWVAGAPNNEQRAAATILHQATRSAISSNSEDPFGGDDVVKATLTVQLFCGAVG